ETVFFRLFHFFGGRLLHEPGFIYLVMKNQPGDNVLELTYRFADGDAYGSLYLPDTLGTGAYQLFAYSDAMHRKPGLRLQPVDLFVLNRFDENLEGVLFSDSLTIERPARQAPDFAEYTENLMLVTNKEKYSRREPVYIEIQNPGQWLDVSVSVARQETFLPAFPSPNRFSPPAEAASQPWPPIREQEEYLLSGKLMNGEGNEGIGWARVLLSKPDTLLNLLYAETDEKGRFVFSLPGYYFGNALYLHLLENNLSGSHSIILDDKWAVMGAEPFFPPAFDASMKEFFGMMQTTAGVTKAYQVAFGAENAVFSGEPDAIPPLLYSRPTHTYLLDEYEPLDDLKEIARELIPYLRIRRQADGYSARIMDQNQSYAFFDRQPMIFLDAVPMERIDTLLELNSSQLSRIEVVSYPWRYGQLEFAGILALFSSQRESLLPGRVKPSKVFQFPEVHAFSRFVSPDYAMEKDRLRRVPDFRHTLLWEPRLQIEKGENKQIKFFTGDLPGNYTIFVKGITKDGKSISQTKTIQVEL
ncbi:MAG: hypothetical protein K0B09_10465, partial [Bacteroidales bacterium]|nr:hypothetical protein [Bacteroidales bacterium]